MKDNLYFWKIPARIRKSAKRVVKNAIRFAIAVLIAANGCFMGGLTVIADSLETNTFVIQTNHKTMAVGESFSLKLVNLTGEQPVWSSDNQAVAEVDENGVITAKGGGKAEISVSAGNYYKTCRLTVEEMTAGLEGIDIAEPYVAHPQTKGATFQLHLKTAEGISPSEVIWTSSNPNCCSVDDKGRLSFTGYSGKNYYTTITASMEKDGVQYTDYCGVYASSNAKDGRYMLQYGFTDDAVMNREDQLIQYKYYDNREQVYRNYETLVGKNQWLSNADGKDYGYISDVAIAAGRDGGGAFTFCAPDDGIVNVALNYGQANAGLAGDSYNYADIGIYRNEEQVYFCDVSELEKKYPPTISAQDGKHAGLDIPVRAGEFVYIRALMPEDATTERAILKAWYEAFEFKFTKTGEDYEIDAPEKLVIAAGESKALGATASAEGSRIRYMSSDENVAVVDENGLVTVNADAGKGNCRIYSVAELDGMMYAGTVTEIETFVRAEIWLSSYTIDLHEGEAFNLRAAYDDLTEGAFQFESSNPEIVAVEPDGKVTAVAKGVAEISVSDDANKKICMVYVGEKKKPGLVLNPNNLAIPKSSTYTIAAEVAEEYVGKKLVWSSDNSSIADVGNGIISGIAEGQTVIRAALAEDPEVYDECSVMVGTVNTYGKFATSDTSNLETSVLQYGSMKHGTMEWNRFPIKEAAKYRMEDGSCAVSNAQIFSNSGYDADRVFCAPASGVVDITLKPSNTLYLQTGEMNSATQGKGRLEIIHNGKVLKSIPMESYKLKDGTYAYGTSYDGGEAQQTGDKSARAGVNLPEEIGVLSVPVHKGEKIHVVMRCESAVGVAMANWQGFVFEYRSNRSADAIEVAETEARISAGRIYDGFDAVLKGKEIEKKDLEFVSADTEIAKVSKEGVIKGETEGRTRVYALNRENKLLNYVDVTVEDAEISVTEAVKYQPVSNQIVCTVKNDCGEPLNMQMIAVMRTKLGAPDTVYEGEKTTLENGELREMKIINVENSGAAKIDVYLIRTEENGRKCIHAEEIALK